MRAHHARKGPPRGRATLAAVACLAAATGVPAATAWSQTALVLDVGSTPGWRFDAANPAFAYDTQVTHGGRRSLGIRHEDGTSERGYDRIVYELPATALSANRLRVAALVRTAIEDDGAVTAWIRVVGDRGLLYVDRAREFGATGVGDWRALVIEAPIDARARRVGIGLEFRGRGRIWIDEVRAESRIAADLPPPSAQTRRYVDNALAILEANSLRREHVDWVVLRRETLAQARGDDSIRVAHLAVRYALSLLGDAHSYFMTPGQMRDLRLAPVGNARTGRAAEAANVLRLGPTVGYVELPGFAGGTQHDQAAFAEGIQASLAALGASGVCRWIVDLRGNQGGNLWPMLAGIGPLLGDGNVAAARYPDGRRVPVWYREGKVGFGDYVRLRVRAAPYRPPRPARPVAILIGPETASAAEIVALAFRGRDATRSFGGPTAGASSGTRVYPLEDDAAIVLAVSSTLDRHGTAQAGPIEPDLSVDPVAAAHPVAAQPAVRAALAWLANAPGC